MSETHDEDDRPRSRIRRLGRRLMGEHEIDPEARGPEGRSILGEAKEVFGAVLEGGDKAKSEVVRAVAREVRNYLEELGLKEDIHHLLTNYSLELHASVNLRRLAEHEKTPREERRRKEERPRPEPAAESEEDEALP